jgi:hypothetical protein
LVRDVTAAPSRLGLEILYGAVIASFEELISHTLKAEVLTG